MQCAEPEHQRIRKIRKGNSNFWGGYIATTRQDSCDVLFCRFATFEKRKETRNPVPFFLPSCRICRCGIVGSPLSFFFCGWLLLFVLSWQLGRDRSRLESRGTTPQMLGCPPPGCSTMLSERLMRSWARQRFVAASSRRTDEKVASRRGSGRHCRRASRARALSLSLRAGRKGQPALLHICKGIGSCLDAPEEAPHDVLQQPRCLLLD